MGGPGLCNVGFGVALPPTQALGSNFPDQDFQDAMGFLNSSGHRGPQRRILREGTYAINLAQFAIITARIRGP